MSEDYTTIRVKRTTKADIEKIAAGHKIETGETLDASQVTEIMTSFFVSSGGNGEKEFDANKRNVDLIQEIMEILGLQDCENIPATLRELMNTWGQS